MNYVLIRGSIADFEAKVENYLKMGYALQGGVFVLSQSNLIYIQAMYKPKTKSNAKI